MAVYHVVENVVRNVVYQVEAPDADSIYDNYEQWHTDDNIVEINTHNSEIVDVYRVDDEE